MTTPLVVLNQEECAAANRVHNDPEGWKYTEARANYKVRADMRNMTDAINLAVLNPTDDDCQKLLQAIAAAITRIRG